MEITKKGISKIGKNTKIIRKQCQRGFNLQQTVYHENEKSKP